MTRLIVYVAWAWEISLGGAPADRDNVVPGAGWPWGMNDTRNDNLGEGTQQ
jgi:hypothetical protein